MTKVSVVIPFYQEKEGILKAAVVSALNQKTSASVQIIVVDDESPISAHQELQDLQAQYPDAILIIEKKNAGAGAARNTGLDHLGPDTDYVAFLDSDDVWFDSHLERAVWALGNGFDFYFSDFYQLDQQVTAFARAGRIRTEEHKQVHPSEPIREYSGDMITQIVMANIIGTPTVAYNFAKYPDIRFPKDLLHAGEDYIFWLRLASSTKRIAFSSEPECRCGAGVNLYAEMGWGTDKYLKILHDDIKYRKYLLANFKLTPEQRASIFRKISSLRLDYCRGFIHNLLHNRRFPQARIWDHFKLDPATFAALILVPGLRLYQKLRRRGPS
jgi:succinoglycan biosynthesis protein ExoW